MIGCLEANFETKEESKLFFLLVGRILASEERDLTIPGSKEEAQLIDEIQRSIKSIHEVKNEIGINKANHVLATFVAQMFGCSYEEALQADGSFV